MAVGISRKKSRLAEFRAQFDEVIQRTRNGAATDLAVELSGWLQGTDLTEQLMGQLAQLHPFGMGNPEPIFGVRGVRLRTKPSVFKEQHFRFTAEDDLGRRVSGVAWKMAERLPPVGPALELAIQLNWNYYNGRQTLQLELHDWRTI
jgi:single-stranded-DNA-specific exonuclease